MKSSRWRSGSTIRPIACSATGSLPPSSSIAGQNREALASLQRGGAHRDRQRQRALSYRFGWDQGLAILSFEVLVRLSMGLLDSAARLRGQALAEISAHGHATTIASATFCVRTWPQLALGELAALERDSTELARFCTEKKVEQIRLLASVHQAYARAMREPSRGQHHQALRAGARRA